MIPTLAWLSVAVAVVAVLVPAAFLLWLDFTAPNLWIEDPASPITQSGAAKGEGSTSGGGRLIRGVLLEGPDHVPIEATISRPSECASRLPILVLVGGFDTGMRSVDRVPDPGLNVVIGYGYPDRNLLRADAHLFKRLVAAQRGAHRVPGQIAALAVWAAGQPWADRHRIVLVGVSLGAVLAPAAARAMVAAGVPPIAIVLADGGAGLTMLAKSNLRRISAVWRPPAAWAIAALLRRLEPACHLPHLQGQLLLIHGTADRFIPTKSAVLMDRLTPEPKTVVTLSGGHILPSDPTVLNALSVTVHQWLASIGAVNGSTSPSG